MIMIMSFVVIIMYLIAPSKMIRIMKIPWDYNLPNYDGNWYQDRNVVHKFYHNKVHVYHAEKSKYGYTFYSMSDYYRKLRNNEFGLYLIPRVLRAKKKYGSTEKFYKKVQQLIGNVQFGSMGNLQDEIHAKLIQASMEENYSNIFRDVYNHKLLQ